MFRPVKQEDVPEEKKIKTEDAVDGDTKEADYREQVKILYEYRDKLKTLEKSELIDLLEANKQDIPVGIDKVCILNFLFI